MVFSCKSLERLDENDFDELGDIMLEKQSDAIIRYEANPFSILIRKPWYRVGFSTFFKTFFGYIRADQVQQGVLDYLFLGIPAFLKWAYSAVDRRVLWSEWQKGVMQGILSFLYFSVFGLPMFLLASLLVLLISIPLIFVNIAAIFKEIKLPDELANVPCIALDKPPDFNYLYSPSDVAVARFERGGSTRGEIDPEVLTVAAALLCLSDGSDSPTPNKLGV